MARVALLCAVPCVSLAGWDLDVAGGPAVVFDDAYRFGNYTGTDEDGAYLFGDLVGDYRGAEQGFVELEAYSRGQDAWGLFAEAGERSRYAVRASLQSIPTRSFNTTATPFAGAGASELTLPADWVRGPTTAQMTLLSAAARTVAIGSERRNLGLGVDFTPSRAWDMQVDYRRQERDGVARSSGSMLFSALEFTSPVDYVTDDVEVSVAYAGADWQTSLAYFHSSFSNRNPALAWDNPYTAVRGNARGQQALAPDNSAQRITLAGAWLLPARTTLSGHVSTGRLEQDTGLLPFTVNASLPAGALPALSARAEVDTLSADLRAVSSPLPRLTLQAELRYKDFDNDTVVDDYAYVITDTLPADRPAASTAYDYQRRDIQMLAEYRILGSTRLAVGFAREQFDRARQARTETETDRLSATLRSRVRGAAEIRLETFAEDRDGSEYAESVNPASPQNPLLRKYNLADRERSGVELRGTVFGSSSGDLGLQIEYSQDSYDRSAVGLTGGDYLRVGADASVLLGNQTSAFASLYQEHFETDQAGSQDFSVPDWTATTDDEFTVAMVGLAHPELFGVLDASIEFSWAQSIGQTRTDTAGLASAFPDLKSTERSVSVKLSYPVSPSLDIGLNYYLEKLRTDDWALDQVGLDTVPGLLSLGAQAWNYDVQVIYLRAQYRMKSP